MTFSVTMPALGESVSEGTVTRWLKSEGDHVNVDEPLLEVSTDKVDTEIPSPVAGILTKIVVQVDQTVPVGAELAIIADGAAAPAPSAPVVAAPAAPVTPPPAAPVAAAPAPAAARPAPPPAAATKVTYAADTFFDFDKSVLKADGKAKLDDLAGKVKAINLEVIIAVGHTDSAGSDAYNQKLSVKRADAVKAYLITKGIEKNRVYTEGKGEKQPVADNKTDAGRSKNRRVEIEVVGTRPN